MRQAGLVPRIVDVDYFAPENGFELNYQAGPDETIGLIDIGAQSASVHIVKQEMAGAGGQVETSRLLSEDELTEASHP